jgi:DNA topoisomerase-2
VPEKNKNEIYVLFLSVKNKPINKMSRISYEKMDPITHIHKRPDMYLGTLEPKTHEPEWVLDGAKMKLLKEPRYSDGLWRIFLEPISNVVDNVWRSRQAKVECKKIKVDIDPETAEITIWNDGRFIPIEINEETKMYNPELIFGNLLTSSNYNDEEERLSSGRNGLGVKLTNVFSTSFHVECGDPEKGLVYSQTWKNHMRDIHNAKIKKKQNTGYTCVRFVPDLSLFRMEKLDSTILGLFKKTCADMSMLTAIPVLLNKEKINIHSLKEYAALYPQVDTKQCLHWNNNDIQKKKDEELEIVVCPSFDEEYHEIAFVNGIYNKEGGAHADAVSSEFFKAILAKINKGRTVNTFSVKDIKPQFTIFVRASLINPSFSNQNKTRLQSPTPKVDVDPKFVQTVCTKWGFMEKMNELMQAREYISLKKTEKKRGYKKIEGLDNANKAGGKESKDCTLILCEGLSAKTYAVKGVGKGWNGKKGRDYFGVFPLRGKVMNARNATTSSISANKEITSVIQALNLKYKTDYTQEENFNTLSYGKVMIITDADVDGLHIASLIINMFHVLFPSLLRREEPFLYSMMTPVAKIFPSTDPPLTFYNDFEYQKELERLTGRRFRTKYYKGLGSSSDQEIKDTFGEKVVSFQLDDNADKTLHMVFSKTTADDRKRWMEEYDPHSYETPGDTYSITNFVNHEHIRFSIDDCKRNIPNLCDGLKLSQRKILYTVFKRNLSYHGKSMKVAQLAGSVAELSNYHHGEQCLYDTIVKLAQEFVGSYNNVPLLFRDGQFGSRLSLGRDAANGRYIHTKMMSWTRILFPEMDDDLLTYTLDDGLKVEPDNYIPILPLIFVNGVKAGIGSGWSSNIASHNPLELVQCVNDWLDNPDSFRMPALKPYFHGFTGEIKKTDTNKFKCAGIITDAVGDDGKNKRKKTETHRITEIPVDCSIDKYKEFLESLMEEKKLKSFKNYSKPNHPDFHITPAETFKPTLEKLNLSSDINMTNIVLFNDGKIKKYNTIHEIFVEFCRKRYDLYEKRKNKMVSMLETSLAQERVKHRFITDVMSDNIVVFKKTEHEVEEQLKKHKYNEEFYPMLYSIQIRSFTKDNVQNLQKKIADLEKQLADLKKTTIIQMWKKELDAFVDEYKKILE